MKSFIRSNPPIPSGTINGVRSRGIKFAQEMLGHKDISITQRYVHYDRDYIKENLDNIEELNRIFK